MTDLSRNAALSVLQRIILEGEIFDWDSSVALEGRERSLFHELVQGTLRHWFYLLYCLQRHCKKLPKRNLLLITVLSAYQILFLDRVPIYAICAEAKNLANACGCDSIEIRFMHALLMKVAEHRESLRQRYFECIRHGSEGRTEDLTVPEFLAALNCNIDLLEALAQGPEGDKRKVIKMLSAQKVPLEIVGWHWSDLRSAEVKVGQGIPDGFHVQSQTSQAVCRIFSEKLLNFSRKQSGQLSRVRVLEPCAGKGGKFFGTLVWLMRNASSSQIPIELEWHAFDRSQRQLESFEEEWSQLTKQFPGIEERVFFEISLFGL